LSKKAVATYKINKIPCGMPNNLTYCGSLKKYLIGVAIPSSNIYDNPSKKAIILNVFIIENIYYDIMRVQKYCSSYNNT